MDAKKKSVFFMLGFVAVGLFALTVGSLSFGLANYAKAVIAQDSHVVFAQSLPLPTVSLSGAPLVFFQKLSEPLALYLPAICYLVVFIGILIQKERTEEKILFAALCVYGALTGISAWVRPDRWHIFLSLSPFLLICGIFADRHSFAMKQREVVGGFVAVFIAALLTLPHFFGIRAHENSTRDFLRSTNIARMGKVKLPFFSGQRV